MKLGKIDDETTSNVGIISGGKANNIVPEECKVEMEARSRDESKLNAQTKHMLDRFEEEAKKVDATIEVSKERVFMGYKFSETDPLPSLVAQAAKDVGLKPQWRALWWRISFQYLQCQRACIRCCWCRF